MSDGTEQPNWRKALGEAIPAEWGREIDVFAQQLELKRQGKIEDKLFAETRLRRGAYGQRYDNGKRHDGVASQELQFPSSLTKGPSTLWDAPGMHRIKIPFGGLTPRQLEVLAEVAEEYSDGILHVTTRQDFQLHFVQLEDTPDLMRRLAAAGITTREACGNTVRNVTGCPFAGVCKTESFDTSPYAKALAFFLLGHPDTQDFGRKFKVAFSGCAEEACGLVNINDLGFVAKTRKGADGSLERGFEMWVGGGLGAVPYQARVLETFLPVQELMPMAQAVCRVFSAHGERKNRARARLKFLIQKVGFDAFAAMVKTERENLSAEPRWNEVVGELGPVDAPKLPAGPLRAEQQAALGKDAGAFARFLSTNVTAQKQTDYHVVTVALPLGDLSSFQARRLAEIARDLCGDALRTTVDQNIVLRHIPGDRLVELYSRLAAADLAQAGAGTILDITACPGTDTCKLGISSSRGLAAELRQQLGVAAYAEDQAVRGLHIKVSGCFNSCGQHHIADMGFLGVSRKVGAFTVPHFQVVLGGRLDHNAQTFGLGIGAVPSKNVPKVVERLSRGYVSERQGAEGFADWVARVGKSTLRERLADLLVVPSHTDDPSFYSDWGDVRQYSIGDIGEGECAGEVVSPVEFGLQESERQVYEAQAELERRHHGKAATVAFRAMLTAARTLVRIQKRDQGDDADGIVSEFRGRFYDTQLFFDPFAGGKFAHYLFRAHDELGDVTQLDEIEARKLVDEAQLFVEAAHACYQRLSEQRLA